MRQSVCVVISTITVHSFLLKMHAGWSCIRLDDRPDIKLVVELFNVAGTGLSLV